MAMAINNKMLMEDIEIFFMPCNNLYSGISSSTVREFLAFDANIEMCVPVSIEADIIKIYKQKNIN